MPLPSFTKPVYEGLDPRVWRGFTQLDWKMAGTNHTFRRPEATLTSPLPPSVPPHSSRCSYKLGKSGGFSKGESSWGRPWLVLFDLAQRLGIPQPLCVLVLVTRGSTRLFRLDCGMGVREGTCLCASCRSHTTVTHLYRQRANYVL